MLFIIYPLLSPLETGAGSHYHRWWHPLTPHGLLAHRVVAKLEATMISAFHHIEHRENLIRGVLLILNDRMSLHPYLQSID